MNTDYAYADTAWACARKKAYRDERWAKQVANRINAREGVRLVAYGCTRCGQYHIGRAGAVA